MRKVEYTRKVGIDLNQYEVSALGVLHLISKHSHASMQTIPIFRRTKLIFPREYSPYIDQIARC